MTLDQFIKIYNVRPADAIVVKKNNIGLFAHYLIYLGFHYGEHKFIANYTNGTKILTYQELDEFAKDFGVDRIRRFKGNELQRKTAVTRALSRKDQVSYNLLFNNCEHYSNYVQSGIEYSQQTKVFGTSLAMAGILTAISSKNDTNKFFGIVGAAFGLLTLLVEEDKTNK